MQELDRLQQEVIEQLLRRAVKKQCAECGKEFLAIHGNTKYCSKRCRQRRL